MPTVIDVLARLANAVIYGTDVFGAIVLRPAIAAVDDRTLTQLLGRIHGIADRRFPAIGAGGLIAAVAMTALAAASGRWSEEQWLTGRCGLPLVAHCSNSAAGAGGVLLAGGSGSGGHGQADSVAGRSPGSLRHGVWQCKRGGARGG